MSSEVAVSMGARRRGRTGPGDETVYREVYDAILAHRLVPGTKLAEDALGEIFGVSRTVVRKALFRLADGGVVDIRPNRGATVASPTAQEARDVFETRHILERAIVERLVSNITDEQLASLRRLAADERAAYENGDRAAWIRLSGDFHLQLAAIAGNRMVSKFLGVLVSRTSLIIALYEQPGTAACSFDEHAALIDAIAAGKAAPAVEMMRRHLQECEDKLDLEEPDAPRELGEVFAHLRADGG